MHTQIIFVISGCLTLLGLGGDWYENKTDFVLIDGCYNFPSGTFNVFDKFCGMTIDNFSSIRSNRIPETIFMFTIERISKI